MKDLILPILRACPPNWDSGQRCHVNGEISKRLFIPLLLFSNSKGMAKPFSAGNIFLAMVAYLATNWDDFRLFMLPVSPAFHSRFGSDSFGNGSLQPYRALIFLSRLR
jgi:hypothetical protein